MLGAVIMSILNSIFPQARAEVFKILFQTHQPEWHMREIVRQSGLNLRTIQRELAMLTESELITSRKDGNRQYFKANEEHPIFMDLCSMVQKDGNARQLLYRALETQAGIEVAFIYGSMAKGEAMPQSDIDLFVIGSIGLRQIVKALGPIREKLHREINTYNLSVAEWRERCSMADAFTKNVAENEKIFIIGNRYDLERLAE